MGFFDHAWKAAAEEYGKNRAEKYGKAARFARFLKMALIVALGIGCIVLWRMGQGQ